MVKNKIFTVVICFICLVSVLSVQSFALMPGVNYGSSLYGSTTFIKGESLYIEGTDIQEWGNNAQISIPLDSSISFYNNQISYGDEGGFYFTFSTPDTDPTSNKYECDIFLNPVNNSGSFLKMGLKLRDSSISFNNKTILSEYLLTKDAFPIYFTATPASLSGIKISGDIKVYNGNNIVAATSLTYSSTVMSSSYSRVVEPFKKALSNWVNTLSIPDGWHTLVVENCYIENTSTDVIFNKDNIDYLRLGVYLPTLDSLPDGLTFRSVANTSIEYRYDLNPLQFIWETINSVLSLELIPVPPPFNQFGSFTIGSLFAILLGIYGLIAILKAFAGG